MLSCGPTACANDYKLIENLINKVTYTTRTKLINDEDYLYCVGVFTLFMVISAKARWSDEESEGQDTVTVEENGNSIIIIIMSILL